jgi:hypothetical protein
MGKLRATAIQAYLNVPNGASRINGRSSNGVRVQVTPIERRQRSTEFTVFVLFEKNRILRE